MKTIAKIAFVVLILTALQSCLVRSHIPEGKTLLLGNVVYSDSLKHKYSDAEIENNIIQTNYRHLFRIMPRLWLYYKTENKTGKLGKWFHNNVAKPPVYLDETMARKSVIQMEKYLFNVGYFGAKVETDVVTHKKYSWMYYKVIQPKPYTIKEKKFNIADTALAQCVNSFADELILNVGDNYDAYQIDKERTLISEKIRDNGYYFFAKEYIYYEVDTALNSHQVNMTIRIDNPKNEVTGITEPHKKYEINDVFIYPRYDPIRFDISQCDTILHEININGQKYIHYFVFHKNPRMRLNAFNRLIQIHKGDLFSLTKTSQTYKSLNNLKIYSLNKISFDTVTCADGKTRLNCNIALQRGKTHYYSLQVEGTNSGGDLGILGSLSYGNKNIFRGGEILNVKLKGELQGQHVMKDGAKEIFNSYQTGVEANVIFPRLVSPFPLRSFSKEYQPKTTVAIGYNRLVRTYYDRELFTIRFGYDWMVNDKVQHIFSPIDQNYVLINPTNEFQKILDKETNQRIKDQYTSHFLFGLSYTFIFSNQNIKNLSDFFYFKADLQTSGNLLSAFNSVLQKNEGYYKIFDIRYAQYIRFSFDFRQYHLVTKSQSLVVRLMAGIGLPYGNSYDMPFEKAFSAGGANGMRGWVFRSLGPGAFRNTEKINIERIGDVQLEANIEYRFPIYNFIKGALFADAGNIWLLKSNETFKDGEFHFNKFYKQLGIDGGLGLRFDASLFILRLDFALPLCDPEKEGSDKWRFSKLQFSDFVMNIGIGYPF
ncbi:MAG: BamA/TamA family outer membrane protein [Bacteroidales bacterium]|nr:BamA/TamA family outer membrane protein [Bacteroidales bacterium]